MEIQRTQPQQLQRVTDAELITTILEGIATTPEELAELHNLPLATVVQVMSNPVFIKTLSQYSQAKANIHFHTRGVQRLVSIADTADDKQALQAIKLLSQYTGNTKPKGEVTVNLDLGGLISQSEKNITPQNPPLDLTEFEFIS